MTAPPPGFVLDEAPQLPPGFELDPEPRGVMDKLLGRGGPREQLWPERVVRDLVGTAVSGVTLPGDVAAGKYSPQPQTPGRLTEEDVFRQDQAYNDMIRRSAHLASVTSPINPGVRAGDRMVPGMARNVVPASPPVPTATALKEAAEGGYESARNMGVEVTAGFVQNMGRSIQSGLERDGVFAELAPKTFTILSKLQSAPPGSFSTLANIDAARKALGHAAGDFTNKTEQLAASRAVEQLDNLVSSVASKDVLAGDAAAAARALEGARGNYAAAMRSNKVTGELDDAVTGAVERGELSARVANSGQNADNSIRQRLASILRSSKESRGYSPEELAKMTRAAEGGAGTNTARFIGNLLGGGGGLGAAVTGGGGALAGLATANPLVGLLATAPAIGYGVKKIANSLTRKEVEQLDELIRKRSPMYRDAEAGAGVVPVDPEGRAALLRALLGSQQQ